MLYTRRRGGVDVIYQVLRDLDRGVEAFLDQPDNRPGGALHTDKDVL